MLGNGLLLSDVIIVLSLGTLIHNITAFTFTFTLLFNFTRLVFVIRGRPDLCDGWCGLRYCKLLTRK